MTETQHPPELTERQRKAARAMLLDCGFSSADQVRAVVQRIEFDSIMQISSERSAQGGTEG